MLALAKSDLVRAHWHGSTRGKKKIDYIILLSMPPVSANRSKIPRTFDCLEFELQFKTFENLTVTGTCLQTK